MQMRPVGSSLLPGEQTQAKEPALFLHTPLTQGLLSHSFKSATNKRSFPQVLKRLKEFEPFKSVCPAKV